LVPNIIKSAGRRRALFNLFSGGARENCAIFSSSCRISARRLLQLLTAAIPSLSRLSREDGGRQKIMQYTRYATLVLAFSGSICS
jgi:preprotein translocase subunit SecY